MDISASATAVSHPVQIHLMILGMGSSISPIHRSRIARHIQSNTRRQSVSVDNESAEGNNMGSTDLSSTSKIFMLISARRVDLNLQLETITDLSLNIDKINPTVATYNS
jgi:hypothetical protein